MTSGVSREALELHATCDVVDMHVESFVWSRLFGYRLDRRHGRGALNARHYSQFDLPRMAEVGMAGAVLSVATNPLRPARHRATVLGRNLTSLKAMVAADPDTEVVSDHTAWLRARAAGRRACFLAVQGGNAVDPDAPPEALDALLGDVSRVTLVHLTDSFVGTTSSPLRFGRRSRPAVVERPGLTPCGRRLVEVLNHRRVLVDLAHISREGFFAALEAHDPAVPAVVSHTGVDGVHPSWRNLDDSQIRAVAATGGVVGIIYDRRFLGPRHPPGPPAGRRWGSVRAATVVDHIEHVIRVGGEDSVALGSDWDGLIVTPRDMCTVTELPLLTQAMLDRGFGADRIAKVLGSNFLRVIEHARPGSR